ncbi:MAG: preprotein translocase subunit YajC [Oscillospiraceae bacterium]|nr:preprotein translocase subunit YajC [Oscillospiraceae bacterium]
MPTESLTSILMIVAMIAIFYFVIMRPENKRKKALKEMLTNLSVGDKITTGSGIVGKVVSIDGDLVTFETGEDRVRIQVIKTAIQTVGDPQTAVATK